MDADQVRRVCVLGPDIADRLQLGENPLGKIVIIGDQPFVVVGVMERKAFAESKIADMHVVNRNRQVFVPYEALRLYFRKDNKGSELDVISLRMENDRQLMQQSQLIHHIVSRLHSEAQDFGVFVPLEKLKQAQETKEPFAQGHPDQIAISQAC